LAADDALYDISKPSVRRSMILMASGALIGLLIAGYGLFTAKGTRSRGVPPEAVALVNGRPILRSDFMTQAQAQFTLPFAQTSGAQRRKTLDDMIDEELMMQRGLEIDLPSYDPDVRNALVAGVELEVSADALAQQPTQQELQQYYEAHKDRYSSEGIMQLRDLVVRSDSGSAGAAAGAVAGAAVAALRHGQALDVVISQYGLVDSGRFMDAGHVDTGNIFQFAVRAKLDDALYNAALALKDGEVSDPLEEPDGVHLIAMVRHQAPVAQGFEEAQNKVFADFKKEAQDKVLQANLKYLHSRADITLSPEFTR
jgi:parvulin-like peptidyl-prolyl isomerase